MDVDAGLETLKLFNEKADKLESLSFTDGLANSGVTISAKIGQAVESQRQGPDEESTDAFVLTMRLFVQDNESISLRNMAKLYSELPVSTELAKKFDDARSTTNKSLDSKPLVSLNGEDLTSRYVFDIFFYGGLAHTNPEKKAVLDLWTKNPILFPILQSEFDRAMGILLNMILFTRNINKAAINELTPTG